MGNGCIQITHKKLHGHAALNDWLKAALSCGNELGIKKKKEKSFAV